MKFARLFALVAVVLGCFAAVGCGHRTKRSSGPAVAGTVVYITNVQLPPDATIELQLVELSRNGETVKVVSGATLPRPPKVPAAFELPYQKGDVRKRTAYGVTAKILSAGNTIFTSPRPTPVLTLGNPARVEVVVEPVRKR